MAALARRYLPGLAVLVAAWCVLPSRAYAQDSAPSPADAEADNSRCYVCHINYKKEELASLHARANVGCQKCHGDSSAHCADEDNVTPPDVMYPREKINPSCMACHPGEKLSEFHEPVLAGSKAKVELCTDCHGDHRLEYRVQQWDKATGKLVIK